MIEIQPDEIIFNSRGLNNFRNALRTNLEQFGPMRYSYTIEQEVKPKWWEFKYKISKKSKFKAISRIRHIVEIDDSGLHITNDNKTEWELWLKEEKFKHHIKQEFMCEKIVIYNDKVGADKILLEVISEYKVIHREERLKKILEK